MRDRLFKTARFYAVYGSGGKGCGVYGQTGHRRAQYFTGAGGRGAERGAFGRAADCDFDGVCEAEVSAVYSKI